MTWILAMLGRVPLRWWLYIAGAAVIGILILREHHAVHRAASLAVEKAEVEHQRDQARADLIAERARAAADLKLSRDTSHALQSRLTDVERDRAQHPLRLRCIAAAVPSTAAEAGAAAGTADAAARRVDGGADMPTFDAAPGLSEYQRRCAVNAAAFLTLQEWETRRTR